MNIIASKNYVKNYYLSQYQENSVFEKNVSYQI